MRAGTVWGGIAAGVAVTAVSAVGVAGAATGGQFMLGRHNSETASASLANNDGTPLILKAPAGSAPLQVDSTREVAHLNAALLDGVPVGSLQRVVTGSCGTGIASVDATGGVSCVGGEAVMRSSGTWTVPAGVHAIAVEAVGAGGGGAEGSKGSAGGGGAGADVVDEVTVHPGEVLDIVIGHGGAGAASTASPGADGSSTDVFSEASHGALLVRAHGGGGGLMGASSRCGSGTGGRATAPSADGVVAVRGMSGAAGSCPAGGGATGFPGSGGASGHGGSGAAGSAGMVTITPAG